MNMAINAISHAVFKFKSWFVSSLRWVKINPILNSQPMIKQAFFTWILDKVEKSNIHSILHDIFFSLISISIQKLNPLFRFHNCHIFLWFRLWIAPARSKKSTKSVWVSFFNFWCQAWFNHALHILKVSFLQAVRKIYANLTSLISVEIFLFFLRKFSQLH